MPWLACKSRRIHYELTGPENGPACVSSERGDNIAHMLRCYIVNLGGNLVDLHYGHN